MGIIKEWTCSDCKHEFDSDVSICPKCSSIDVQRAFRTAPGFMGDNTKFKDSALGDFTKTYGLTDFSNNPNTKHEKDHSALWKPLSDFNPSMAGGEAGLLKSVAGEAKSAVKNPIVAGRDR